MTGGVLVSPSGSLSAMRGAGAGGGGVAAWSLLLTALSRHSLSQSDSLTVRTSLALLTALPLIAGAAEAEPSLDTSETDTAGQ